MAGAGGAFLAGAGGTFLAGAGAFFLAGAGAFFLPFALGAPLTGRRVKMNCWAFPPFCLRVHVVVLIFMLILEEKKNGIV